MPKKRPEDDDVTETKLDPKDLEKEGATGEAAGGRAAGGGDFADEAVAMSEDVPVKLVAVLGRKNMILKDLLRFKVGQAIDLERAPNEFVDLIANGKLIAKGELVEIDGKLGVRIIKMLK